MEESSNGQNWGANEASSDVRAHRRTLRGGHDPAELGRLSGERRRERKKQREEAAAYDALTVEARAAMAMAESFTYAHLVAALEALCDVAKKGNVTATRELRAWIELSTRLVSTADNTQGVDWGSMTPQQRAAARAQIERRLAELAIHAQDGDEHP
jgi:hypothetical protein